MDNVLGELRDDGRLESSGYLTIDPAGALRRLRSMEVSQAGHALLALVQAGVLLSARSMAFQLGKSHLRFVCELPHPLLDDLTPVLENPLGAPAHLRSLAWAWQALLAENPAALVLNVGGRVYRQDRESFDSESDARCTLTLRFERKVSGATFWERLKELAGVRTQEHKLLCDSAFLCPVPVTLDGRYLNNPVRAHELVKAATDFYRAGPLPSRFVLCERLEPGPGFLATNPAQQTFLSLAAGGEVNDCGLLGDISSSDWPRLGLILDWRQPDARLVMGGKKPEEAVYVLSTRFHGFNHSSKISTYYWREHLGVRPRPALSGIRDSVVAFCHHAQEHPLVRASLFLALGRGGGVYFVRFGVISDFKPVDLGTEGAVAIVLADDLTTDLSFLTVVENEAYQAMIEELRAAFAQMKELAISRLDRLIPAGEAALAGVAAIL